MNKMELIEKIEYIINASKEELIKDDFQKLMVYTEQDLLEYKLRDILMYLDIAKRYD